MEPREYKYIFKPLLLTGIVYLTAFPLIFGGLVWVLHINSPQTIYGLAIVFSCNLVIISLLLLSSWRKSIIITDDEICFTSKLLRRVYRPRDINAITLYANKEGREFLRISAKKKTYFLDEQYLSWGILINDLEDFTRKHNISSNLLD